MGINYTYEGGFTFDHPIPVSKIPADSPHLPANYNDAAPYDHPVDLLFEIDSSGGEAVATRIVPAGPDHQRRMGDIEGELRALMDVYHAEHVLSGELIMAGDDLGAVTTVTVFGGRITVEDEDDESNE
ncbi:hypothetical protein AB0F17_34850 [Nonomuraea sp. NPDC026600]|uniref:hypothetical protein n=1 Tax=Nonomuraea sp. NPDC026600 TaxID=3155363 RepID=UPI0033FF365F